MQDPQETSAENQTNKAQESGKNATESGDARVTELENQLAQVRKESQENWARYLRERADAENFRKRQERLVSDRVQQQKKALFKQILEVMDNVERALVFQETMDKAQLQQTLRMLQWQMNEVLRAEGLQPVATVGEAFNPYVHEAIEAIESNDKPDGTVLEEVRKGYTLGEETLRPARVKVSVGNNAGNNK
jgi:molecular chaperone GrpE